MIDCCILSPLVPHLRKDKDKGKEGKDASDKPKPKKSVSGGLKSELTAKLGESAKDKKQREVRNELCCSLPSFRLSRVCVSSLVARSETSVVFVEGGSQGREQGQRQTQGQAQGQVGLVVVQRQGLVALHDTHFYSKNNFSILNLR